MCTSCIQSSAQWPIRGPCSNSSSWSLGVGPIRTAQTGSPLQEVRSVSGSSVGEVRAELSAHLLSLSLSLLSLLSLLLLFAAVFF